ncbi:MAG: hypothetical protein SWK90_18295 [Chloroflexota bacterium]|nr:hypothetical protein [Chloroflexota bacterium]
MKLADIVNRVVVDPRKLTDYALDPEAPWRHHKAMVFRALLGFTRENYADLLAQIEGQALEGEAIFHSEDEFGRRYTVDLLVRGTEEREAIVRTGWLVSPGACEARLVTLYVRKSRAARR